MRESMNPGKYSRHKASIVDDDPIKEEEKSKEAFTKLSASTITNLIEDELDTYSIEDVKVRYK